MSLRRQCVYGLFALLMGALNPLLADTGAPVFPISAPPAAMPLRGVQFGIDFSYGASEMEVRPQTLPIDDDRFEPLEDDESSRFRLGIETRIGAFRLGGAFQQLDFEGTMLRREPFEEDGFLIVNGAPIPAIPDDAELMVTGNLTGSLYRLDFGFSFPSICTGAISITFAVDTAVEYADFEFESVLSTQGLPAPFGDIMQRSHDHFADVSARAGLSASIRLFDSITIEPRCLVVAPTTASQRTELPAELSIALSYAFIRNVAFGIRLTNYRAAFATTGDGAIDVEAFRVSALLTISI